MKNPLNCFHGKWTENLKENYDDILIHVCTGKLFDKFLCERYL